MEYQKVKCKADCNKNKGKLINYASCASSIFKPLKVLPARGFKLNKKNKM